MQVLTIEKRADWSRIYQFDFTTFAEVSGGETISSPSVPAVSGLTIGTPSAADGVVSVRISGGTAGTKYTVTCTVTTSGGSTLSIEGRLSVK